MITHLLGLAFLFVLVAAYERRIQTSNPAK